MLWLLAGCGGDVAPPNAHGTVLHKGPHTLVVQHDDLRNRVVPGIERYEAAGVPEVSPGDSVDLWLTNTRVDRLVVTGKDELPADFQPAGHPITGTVVNVDGIRISLDHDPVPGVMGAMVMGFGLARWETDALATGDRIEGRLLRSGYGWQLVDPVVTGRADSTLREDIAPLEVGEVLPRTEMVGDDGKPLVVGEGQGVPTALTFIYTRCPDPSFCPAIAARMAALQGQLDEARIVTVTLDPQNDSPKVLRGWGQAMGSDLTKWRLARAEPLVLQALALRSGQHVTVDGGRISHLHRLMILDADGRLIERYDTSDWPAERVVGQLEGH